MAHKGRTSDNNRGENISDIFIGVPPKEIRTQIESIADKTVKKLTDEHENLLIFPSCLGSHDDDIGKQTIFSLNGELLETGNAMGFIGKGNIQLTIHSRFYQDEDDHFLHYMLQKVFSINIFDLKTGFSSEQLWDFLIYLFPVYLEKALRQGVFREYQNFEFNDSNLKGAIDISRHLQSNIPFRGNIAYRTREYSYNNRITQLIRHTIEVILKKQRTRIILTNNNDIKEAVSKIQHVTPNYCRAMRQQVIAQNLRKVAHPYYTDYLPLQKLCIQILRHEKLTYGNDEKEIYGILFDGAWLWEEYLNTILTQCGFTHAENKTGRNRIYLFKDNTGYRYPDFYKDDIVIDAKYKRMNKTDDNRDDIHQLISYMYIRKATRGIFIYPRPNEEGATQFQDSHQGFTKSTLNGYGGVVSKYGFNITQDSNSFEEFSSAMKNEENKTIQRFRADTALQM